MGAKDFMSSIEKKLQSGDALMERGLYREAVEIYQQIVDLFRAMEKAQEPEAPGGPTQVPLSLRLMVLNRDLIVPLDRLAEAYFGLGEPAPALRCLREVVRCLEKAVGLAGGETRAQFEKDLAKARNKLAEAERSRSGSIDMEERFWVAYRGRDTGQEIRVYPETNEASAERLRLLLRSAAQHQAGQVSQVFEADSEAEALRMAPFQFF